ncbi:2,3-dihydroxybenzoate-AMP ligase, partial [Klebsiella pneumoniae]|nr:2,3-dihydroxybenzoate-AMP ligase [Klebsiella pneumoniae]
QIALAAVVTQQCDAQGRMFRDKRVEKAIVSKQRVLAIGNQQRQGLKRGETALVQLGNVAEFYMTFFALLRIGVAPVNALFSH